VILTLVSCDVRHISFFLFDVKSDDRARED